MPAESYPQVFHNRRQPKLNQPARSAGRAAPPVSSQTDGSKWGWRKAAATRKTNGRLTSNMSTPAANPTTFTPSTFTQVAKPTSSRRTRAREGADRPPMGGDGELDGSAAEEARRASCRYSERSSGLAAALSSDGKAPVQSVGAAAARLTAGARTERFLDPDDVAAGARERDRQLGGDQHHWGRPDHRGRQQRQKAQKRAAGRDQLLDAVRGARHGEERDAHELQRGQRPRRRQQVVVLLLLRIVLGDERHRQDVQPVEPPRQEARHRSHRLFRAPRSRRGPDGPK
eukprot:scaffold32002_cov94-Isochrysis_galbana.AAC.2